MRKSDICETEVSSLMRLPLLLSVVLICSLMLPMGFYLFTGWVFSNNVSSAEFFLVMTILFVFGAPLLLGLALRPGKYGAKSGFLGMIWILIVLIGAIFQVEGFLESWFPGFNSFYAIDGLIIVGTIVIVLVDTG